jgi:hypothetical protein
MTLIGPVLNRSRNILWVVTGAEERFMLKRLQNGDTSVARGDSQRDFST